MSDIKTTQDLDVLCGAINRAKPGGEVYKYRLDGSKDGWALRFLSTEGSGDVLGGHVSKDELYIKMDAFLLGMLTVQNVGSAE